MNKFLSTIALTVLAYLLPHHATAQIAVPIDTIIIQLQSGSDSYAPVLVAEMETITRRFLGDYFTAFYNMEGEISKSYRGIHVDANSFGVQGTVGSFTTTIEFDGNLFFDTDPIPTPQFLLKMITNAFNGLNLDLYLESILSSDDPFLQDLSNIIMEINNENIADTSIAEYTMNNKDLRMDDGKSWNLDKWAEVAIYATAGVAFAVLVLGMVYACRCVCNKKAQVQDEGDRNSINLHKKAFEDDDTIIVPHNMNMMKQAEHNHHMGSSKSHRTHSDAIQRQRSPASPSQSIVSQDSSLFTYNPVGMSRDLGGGRSIGSLSSFHIDNTTTSFDVEGWQNQAVISAGTKAPFGHDISAIEQKDPAASSMMDCDDSVLRTRSSQRMHTAAYKKTLSSGRDRSYPQSRSSTMKPPYPPRHNQHRYTSTTIVEASGQESSTEASLSDSGSSDVINDLKNLSLQIDQHRRQSKQSPLYGRY